MFMYIAVIMLVLFILDNLVMLELSSRSLNEQGQRQIQIQKKHQQEQIREAETQLHKDLDMQMNLLARLVRGPLISRAAEAQFESGEVQLVNQLQPCFQLNTDTEIAQCLKYRTHRLTGAVVASVKKGLIVGAIQALLNDADLVGVYIEDWEGTPYSGFWKNADHGMVPLTSLKSLPEDLQRLEKEVKVDWEYWGKIVFFFSSRRIDEMRRSAEAEIQEAIRLIDRNIAEQRKQLLAKRLAEGVLLFILLLGALFYASFMIILRPLRQLQQNAYQLAQGDLSCPIETNRSDELGELAASFVHMRDAIREQINRLESVNQSLQQKEERLSAFIRALPDPICVFNRQGECEEVLIPRQSSLFKASGGDAGQSAKEYLCQALAAELRAGIHQTLETGISQPFEFKSDFEDKAHWFEGRPSPMRNAAGATELVICLVRDITHQKEAAALNQARIEAQAANEAKSIFLATMSHEIRTPMNAILGMADLLWESQLSAEQKQYVSIFRNAGENLLSIINDILDLSKIESGYLALNESPFNLVDTIERVCEDLAFQAHKKHIELICSIDTQVPTELVGDMLRLRQVLSNLLANAIKFTASGEVEVSVAPLHPAGISRTAGGPAGESGDTVLLFSVRDTGCGIPEQLQEKIFDPFTQVEPYSTRKYGGTGLGLTICRHLVTMMQGRIWVDQTCAQGTTFKFSACFRPVAVRQAVRPPVKRATGRMRVLLADTNRACLESMRGMIAGFGIDVQTAANGKELVTLLSAGLHGNGRVHILFIDAKMHLPGQFHDIVAAHRQVDPSGFKLFALISHQRKDDHAMFKRIGAEACFIKPLKRSELLNALDNTGAAILPAPAGDETCARLANPFLRPPRILLVEDNVNNQMLFIHYLKAICHPIDVADNGRDGVEKFKNRPYDAVFMDLAMPVMDGYEATRRIRRWESAHARPPAPVIALTADALIGSKPMSIDAGCTCHIIKPFTRAQILDALVKTVHPEILKPTASAKPAPYLEFIDAGLHKLIPSYFHNTREDIKKLKQALEKEDWPTLKRIGHAIKGSSLAYGFKQMGQIGRQIEEAVRHKEARLRIGQLILRLIDYTDHVQIKFIEPRQHQENEELSLDKESLHRIRRNTG